MTGVVRLVIRVDGELVSSSRGYSEGPMVVRLEVVVDGDLVDYSDGCDEDGRDSESIDYSGV